MIAKTLSTVVLAMLFACGGSTDTGAQDSALTAATIAPPPATAIDNFQKVKTGIYRGGHPGAEGLDYLKRLGIRTIVDLEVGDFIEAFPWDIRAEEIGAADRGIALRRFPMVAYTPGLSDGFDREINQVLAILRDPAQMPIYVHCRLGRDRTGLVIGLERALIEHWAPVDAHDEMLRLGFRKAFIGLDEYFDRKTGWEDD